MEGIHAATALCTSGTILPERLPSSVCMRTNGRIRSLTFLRDMDSFGMRIYRTGCIQRMAMDRA